MDGSGGERSAATGASTSVGTAATAPATPPSRSSVLSVAALVAWTLFVWGGRVRNLAADGDLVGWDLWGPMLLSGSFVVLGLAVAVLAVQRRRHPGLRSAAARLTALLGVLAGWTIAVWVVRAGDIALGGDHEVGFVVVHVVLAAVSIGLAAWAWTADRKVRTIEHTTAVTTSQERMA